MERFHRTREILNRAQSEGFPVTFHVSKVKSRRWNWVLTMRYMESDPVTGKSYPEKAVLGTSKTREPLDALKERLETTHGSGTADTPPNP